jgi:hypothetical protein
LDFVVAVGLKAMSRGRWNFKRSDLTRAVMGVNAAGMKVARCEIDRDGKIILIAANGALGEATDAEEIGPATKIVL